MGWEALWERSELGLEGQWGAEASSGGTGGLGGIGSLGPRGSDGLGPRRQGPGEGLKP